MRPGVPPEDIPVRSFGPGYDRITEWLPITFVERYREVTPTPTPELLESIRTEGFREPLVMMIGQKDRMAVLCEGNHRLQAAKALGLATVPVRVYRYRECIPHAKPAAMSRVPVNGYVPADMKPSDVFDDLRDPEPDDAVAKRQALAADLRFGKPVQVKDWHVHLLAGGEVICTHSPAPVITDVRQIMIEAIGPLEQPFTMPQDVTREVAELLRLNGAAAKAVAALS